MLKKTWMHNVNTALGGGGGGGGGGGVEKMRHFDVGLNRKVFTVRLRLFVKYSLMILYAVLSFHRN